MGAFDELQAKLNAISTEARRILKAKQVTEKLAVPGTATWMGYDIDNKPVVKKNGKLYQVKATGSISLPIGSIVYIDETYTIQYKSKPPRKEERKRQGAEPGYDRRAHKRPSPTLIGPRNITAVKGSTWLVYTDYLKSLELTTDAEVGTNPQLFGWSLFLSLAPLAVLGGGVLLGIIYWTLFDPKVEPVGPIPISNLPTPDNHPDLESNSGLGADDYNFLIILQGVVDQFAQSYPFLPTDGFWLGINQAIGNAIFFIGKDTYSTIDTWQPPGCNNLPQGITYSDKYVLRPWEFSSTDQLIGLLYHFGPFKAQACLYRIVGVYPPKRFKINVHAWEVPDFDLPDLDEGTEGYFEALQELLPMKHGQFIIPDDIPGWNALTGNGTINNNNERTDVFPYEIIPAHEAWAYGQAEEQEDLTKFATFSENNLFLNYVIKAYAPWTDLDDSLRINYYALNIRVTNPIEEDGDLQFSHSIKVSTFDLPQEFRFDGNIYVEDPQFPLAAGDRPEASRQITYRIQGSDDPANAVGTIFISCLRGEPEKRGLLPGIDPDSPPVTKDNETGLLKYIPGLSLVFSVQNAPAGFVYNQYTGEYIFDQNVGDYAIYGTGQGTQFDFTYTVRDPAGAAGGEAIGSITIYLVGSSSTFVSSGFPVPEAIQGSIGEANGAPPPDNEWDPEPIVESSETGEDQIFNKIRTEIPLPNADSKGCAWVLGRYSRLNIKEVEPPIIKLKVGEQYFDNPAGYEASDFIFSVQGDGGRLNQTENFITDFTVKKKNYDSLAANQELIVTYTIKADYNKAPYVGNWENLTDAQKRKIKSDHIKFAFANDWRGRIPNDRTENSSNNINSTVNGPSYTRDNPRIPELNIDIPNSDIVYNYIKEFYWYDEDPDKVDPKMALVFTDSNGTVYTYEDESIRLVNLQYEFSQNDKELLFYAPTDVLRRYPLDDESIQQAIDDAVQFEVKRKWVWDVLPSGTDRSDDSGNKWRVDREKTQPSKGYLIFGWAD